MVAVSSGLVPHGPGLSPTITSCGEVYMVSIYSPAVKAEARRFGITELQAYRKLQARETILLRTATPSNRERVFNA